MIQIFDSSSERIESRTSVSSMHNKRESSKDENKAKDNDSKTKRSNSSVSGSKDNGETVSKVIEAFQRMFKRASSIFADYKICGHTEHHGAASCH